MTKAVVVEHVFYFAYGSNMSVQRIRSRIPRVQQISGAMLQGYCLQVHKVGKDGSAKCDIVPTDAPGAAVHGVLFRLPQFDLASLDRVEGCGHGYKRITVTVRGAAGETMHGQTYVATLIDPRLRPYSWYMEHVLRGATAGELPADYIDRLTAVACTEDPDRERHARELAIYGN